MSLTAFNSAIGVLNKSIEDLSKNAMARDKFDREKENFNINKKIYGLKIDQLINSGKISDIQRRNLEERSKQYWENQNKILKAKEVLIDDAENKTYQTANTAGAVAKNLFKTSPDVQQMVFNVISKSKGTSQAMPAEKDLIKYDPYFNKYLKTSNPAFYKDPMMATVVEDISKKKRYNDALFGNKDNQRVSPQQQDVTAGEQQDMTTGEQQDVNAIVGGNVNPQQQNAGFSNQINEYKRKLNDMPDDIIDNKGNVVQNKEKFLFQKRIYDLEEAALKQNQSNQNQSKENKVSVSLNQLNIPKEDLDIIEGFNYKRKNGENIKPDEILSEIDPNTAIGIKGLIDYEIDPGSLAKRNNAQWQMIKIAKMVDPSYDPTKYLERKKYRLDLANEGSFIGKQRTSLNTVAHHLYTLDNRIDMLKGGNITPVNFVVNFAREIKGDPSITDYKMAQDVVFEEMQRLLSGVGVTQAGMEEMRKIINPNTGYEAKKQAVKTLVEIVEGRVDPLRQSFKKRMGKEEDGEILYPETKEIFDNFIGSKYTSSDLESEADMLIKKHLGR